MVKCEQQYSGQFVVINSTCKKLLVKNQTEGLGIQNWSFLEHYFEQLELFNWKTIYIIKNYEPF